MTVVAVGPVVAVAGAGADGGFVARVGADVPGFAAGVAGDADVDDAEIEQYK